ncbi:MAG: hypothetical protein CRN43_15870 [Candidatus Nephrothrix sp. EaCA]|nr:MAG: hypothetical protein CRN43_15870 [Candidatus Nephrothrix sp. EaCA]
MKRLSGISLAAVLLFSGCFGLLPDTRSKPPENAEAYVPFYVSGDLTITGEQPRATISPGKIYATDRYIFQNDIQYGIHVIERASEPDKKAKKIAFLQIPSSTEVAVKGDILYTNYADDLLAINISNPLAPRLIKRLPNVFPPVNQHYPPFNGYFVCPDKSKGTIVYWGLQKEQKPACQR